MPIVEFRCDKCEKTFEELVREASSKAGVECPSCKSRSVSRQFSVFAARGGPIAKEKSPASMGGCGRCGDPQGPCSM